MFGLDNLVDMLFDSTMENLSRNERVIQLLKRLKLDPEHPPADFVGVYQYALVEYGVGKPRPALEIFRQSEIQQLFREALEQNNPAKLLQHGEAFLADHPLQAELQANNIDVRREFYAFAAVFIEVAKRTRTPAAILAEQKLESLHRQIATVQDRLSRLPTLEGLRTEMARLATTSSPALPPGESFGAEQCKAFALAQQMRGWFETLGFRFETHEIWQDDYFEWVINIPVRRGRYDRILVRGIDGEAGLRDVEVLKQSVETHRTDEGWLVTARRISRAARDEIEKPENDGLGCYTLDELLDQDADFSGYLTWLEAEIQKRGIAEKYVPLACLKEDIDPDTKQRLGVSRYDDRDGWIDGYIDLWLDDPAKEHISVLGEFGTGKTWFALHYAWKALQHYREAQRRGLERPRLPLIIPLRDYAKAVSVESLFSEFFFRKHEIPIPGYSAFEQLNRMGKLLLIFDGFDEMAARVDRQEMINNFWELAKVVVPGAKVILTCRTEHFPEAKEGRALLNAELQASTRDLTGEIPQFEVLELEKFNDEQIRQVLSHQAQPATVEQIMGNSQLLDLARRPVLTELILEALPDIETGKPVDMSRVYLYAVRHKMERDIKEERTFTSMADKLYFMCELSWEMLSTDRMSINYREFPDRIRKLFGPAVREEKDLDHWHYDMMGQTIFIRDSEGDYSPPHRSLLEFFVAYKVVATLGVMADDFTEIARQQSHLDTSVAPQSYTWDKYFRRTYDSEGRPNNIAPLNHFTGIAFEDLLPSLSKSKLSKAVLDLAHPILNENIMKSQLLPLLWITREKNFQEVGYLGGNIIQLMLAKNPYALVDSDLSKTKLRGVDFTKTYLQRVNLQNACLLEVLFSKATGTVNSLVFSPDGNYLAIGDTKCSLQLWDVTTKQVVSCYLGHSNWIRSVVFSPDGTILASGSDDTTVKLWSVTSGNCIFTIKGHSKWVRSVAFSPDGQTLASGSEDTTVKLWSVSSGACIGTFKGHSKQVSSIAFSPDGRILASGSEDKTIKLWSIADSNCISTLEGHFSGVRSVAFSPDGQILASGSADKTAKIWSISNENCLQTLQGHYDWILHVTFSPNGRFLATSSDDKTVKLWSIPNGDCIFTLKGHLSWIKSSAFSPDSQILASSSEDKSVKLWSTASGECIFSLVAHPNWTRSVAFSPNGDILASGSEDKTIKLWSVASGNWIKTLEGHSNRVRSVVFSPSGNLIASGSADHTVKLWLIGKGISTRTLVGHLGGVLSVAFSSDGNLIASGSDDHTVKIWSANSDESIYTLTGHNNWVLSVAFSSSGKILASASEDRTIKLWLVTSGSCILTLAGHLSRVRTVAFSPNDSIIASGSADQTIKLWSAIDGKCIYTFVGHSSPVVSVAFSPNGEILASGSEDKTIKLWKLDENKCIHTLEGHSSEVVSVAFSPDGKMLVTGSDDVTIRFWNVETGKCIKVIDEQVCSGLDITGTIGLTAGQRTALKLMGAVDLEKDIKSL